MNIQPFNRELLDLINNKFGRSLLNITDKGKIVKISPNSYHILKGIKNGKPLIEATFFTSDRVAEKLLPYVYSSQFHRFAYLTGAFTTNTGEGDIDTGNIGTWAGARGATTGATAATCRTYASVGFDIIRSFFPFNTASIGAGSSIVAGGNTFKLYRDDTVIALFNDDTTSFQLIQTTQASNTALAGGDFDNIAFTSGGSVNLAATSNNTYFTITLNATADGWISKTDHTKLGGILGLDLSNTQPAGVNAIGAQNRGAANPPTLTVIYTPAMTGGYFHFM